MYRLVLQTETTSKAKILKRGIKHYLVGHNFQVIYKLKNDGDELFPGGTFDVVIQWPNGQFEKATYSIPSIEPNNVDKALVYGKNLSITEWGVLCRGFALFFLRNVRDAKGIKLFLHKEGGEELSEQESFHSVLGIEAEEVYQFWAMIAAVVSLLFLVAEKVIQLILENWPKAPPNALVSG